MLRAQRFLEDDDDMMKMCLTRKKLLEHANASSGAGAGCPAAGACQPCLSPALAQAAQAALAG